MPRSVLVGTAAALLAVAAALPVVATASCPGEAPEAVLACFSRAYSDRDASILDGVLAPDYAWVAVSPPEVDVFTREDSFSASVRMFENPGVEFVTLEFEDGYRLAEGKEEGTWRIEDLRATMTIKRESMDEPTSAMLCVTLYVRKTDGEEPGYQVYREVFFEDGGCVSK